MIFTIALRLPPWVRPDLEPIFDLQNNLLGYSCRIFIENLCDYDQTKLADDIGYNSLSRGLEDHGPANGRGMHELTWFQEVDQSLA